MTTDKSQYVKLIADLGLDEAFDAGHCHPSQARILIKKKLAEWHDGKLLVRLRPVHLAVASMVERIDGEDKRQVSEAEILRRQQWLRAIVQAVVNSDTHGSDLAHILGLHLEPGVRTVGPRETLDAMREAAEIFREEILARFPRRFPQDPKILSKEPEPVLPEDDHWFDPDKKGPRTKVPDEELQKLWLDTPEEGFLAPRFMIDPSESMSMSWRSQARAPVTEDPVYTPEDAENDGILLIVTDYAFSENGRRQKRRTPSEPRKCPTCGQGEDTDGDGNCPLCKNFLKIRVVR